MNFHVMTLFPEMIEQGLNTSITGKAIENGIIHLNAVNIRDFSHDKHRHVDDYPYGGGAGMVMQPQPVYDCYAFILDQINNRKKSENKDRVYTPRVIYMTPQGKVFTQDIADALSKEEDLIFLCGHYEGIDERVLEEIVTDHLSIGDYVLTGGELPAMVMIDAISRLVPGVLNNDESAQYESFQDGLLEYPQYTRPPVFHDQRVPEVLLTGNHVKIEQWRREKSVERTLERRPELFETAQMDEKTLECLSYAKGKMTAKEICRVCWDKYFSEDCHDTGNGGEMQPEDIEWLGRETGTVLDIGICSGVRYAQMCTIFPTACFRYTGIEAVGDGVCLSKKIAAQLPEFQGEFQCFDGIMNGIERLSEGATFDAVIISHLFDRMYPKLTKKLLKKVARMTHKGSKIYVELSPYTEENEDTKFAGRHMVYDDICAVYNLPSDTWKQIFMPYFKTLKVSTYEDETGRKVRRFRLVAH